ncbi:MAG TPA: oligopeptide/dipeptide ABC transporter ATP-binding protein [Acidimicrobiales bacterium]|nr:oligopeptide/dipeptide ABC transporter ATP-binding protein [Acidimicrobiales bacterium]
MSDEVVLQATDVVKTFSSRGKKIGTRVVSHAVNGVSLEVRRGETLGIVGESGCGKSTLARCLVQLSPVTSGSVIFEGTTLTGLSRRRLRPYRRKFQLVFQDPYASLNPRRTVGDIVAEPMRINHLGTSSEIDARVRELFSTVGLDAAAINRYPHEFSGGQRQRIGIARSLSLNPTLVIADEPVSALDVSIQAQVLNLMADLQEEFNLTYVFIAHDLGVVRHVSDRVGVMYLGEFVEFGDVGSLYETPLHPYTEALLSVVPELNDTDAPRRERIIITGDVPDPADRPSGCPFHPRCPVATDLCRVEKPELLTIVPGRQVACHYPRNLAAVEAASPST